MSGLDGALQVKLLVGDGRVGEVEIFSPRKNIAPIFVGRSATGAAALAKNLFSLCPTAQSLAAQAAGEAALGQRPDPSRRRRQSLRLLGERFGEMLRASVLDWPQDDPPDPASIAALREILAALRALPESQEAQSLLARVDRASRFLGLRDFKAGTEFFARQWAQVMVDEPHWRLREVEADFLRAGDDEAVAEAMSDPEFCLAPQLDGRCVETGAAARQGGAGSVNGLSGRLAARFADMAATLDAIAALLDGGAPPAGLLSVRNMGPAQGFSAVDSARGRLYHGVRLDDEGRIADYRIVAPTEWNFHPDGPFVRLLRGAEIGTGARARRRVERLAFVFDPCIAVGVAIREAARDLADA
ncbi:nickel-dependent hydrogenase large subunit [uncultured Rhodoblastus sp.]|uniref:nickel-dependent hydrogenase large subunit n=1 Tax=uncultured Rhodoblastus sp. TaxID=543037 RepID=UPI0025F83CB3|nr:nickel-dependent hydrogenase large subunit [uncultured Rhodoblastus sp.]